MVARPGLRLSMPTMMPEADYARAETRSLAAPATPGSGSSTNRRNTPGSSATAFLPAASQPVFPWYVAASLPDGAAAADSHCLAEWILASDAKTSARFRTVWSPANSTRNGTTYGVVSDTTKPRAHARSPSSSSAAFANCPSPRPRWTAATACPERSPLRVHEIPPRDPAHPLEDAPHAHLLPIRSCRPAV